MRITDGNKQRALIVEAVSSNPDIDYKKLSRCIRRNDAYIQQFITKKSPRQLREADMREIMAIINGTSEQSLGEPSEVEFFPEFGFKAGMGGGGVIIDESPVAMWPVRSDYLREIRLDGASLMFIEVEGDSMSPTLESGDITMANRSDKNPARGGIFAIHDSDTVVVKRVEKVPASDPVMLRLISDNKHHNSYDVLADDTNIIGRIVWYGRRI